MKLWQLLILFQLIQTEPIEVFVVPHSHCDPGWWWTFDEYHQKWVVGILDAILNTLVLNPHRHFIWAEISFFKKWFDVIDESRKHQVRAVIQQGRLEFVTGYSLLLMIRGWVMHDEAVSHYRDDLLQLQVGRAWLWKTFQVKPQTAWLIDPFGHSPTTPIFYADLKGAVINRIHYQAREARKSKKDLEFIWTPVFKEPTIGIPGGTTINSTRKSVFVHTLANGYYDIPNTCGVDYNTCHQFEFEHPNSIKINHQNLAERAKVLANQYLAKAKLYQTKYVLVPLGDDFKYKSIGFTEDFLRQWDMLFDYINQRPQEFNLKIRYSNLSSYFDAVKSVNNVQWTTFTGNFLEYADRDDDYWSGFYTSRAILKRWIRESQVSLRFAEMLTVRNQNMELEKVVNECQENLSLLQHHDGVTGTARIAVVNDYRDRLSKCTANVNLVGVKWLENYIQTSPRFLESALPHFPFLDNIMTNREYNIAALKIEKNSINIIIFNSLSYYRNELETSSKFVKVMDQEGKYIPIQVSPRFSRTTFDVDPSKWEVGFYAETNGLSFTILKLVYLNEGETNIVETKPVKVSDSKVTLSNDIVTMNFHDGLLQFIDFQKCVRNACKKEQMKLLQSFMVYDSNRGGVYIFKPNSERGSERNQNLIQTIKLEGPLYSEIYFKFDGGAGVQGQEKGMGHFDQALLVDINQGEGGLRNHDIAVKYASDLTGTDSEMWTDANGWMRIRNEVNPKRTISSQFRPMVSRFSLVGSVSKIEWVTRSSLAVGGYNEGEWEFILDRQTDNDDGRGMGEATHDCSPFIKEFRCIFAPGIYKEKTVQTLVDVFLFPRALSVVDADVNVKSLFSENIQLPIGIVVHSIRKCLTNSNDICIQIEHDNSVKREISVVLEKLPFDSTTCSLYDYDSTIPKSKMDCFHIKMKPFDIKTLRLSKDKVSENDEPGQTVLKEETDNVKTNPFRRRRSKWDL